MLHVGGEDNEWDRKDTPRILAYSASSVTMLFMRDRALEIRQVWSWGVTIITLVFELKWKFQVGSYESSAEVWVGGIYLEDDEIDRDGNMKSHREWIQRIA